MSKFSLAIHGGAGTILKKDMSEEQELAYLSGLQQALNIGYELLKMNGSAMEAVIAATRSLEDNVLFNAGRGSVFASDGSQEMDASIMDGKTLMAGAVSAVKNIKNPISLAHAVMNETNHVLLIGNGANEFAKKINAITEQDEYFYSAFRYAQWKQVQHSEKIALDHNIALNDQPIEQTEKKFGTVGAVACDAEGNIAAATSTGGMTNKQWGRVGDSAIIGAGTYANNNTCAISCTGHGEFFIRAVAAYDVSCLMEYSGMSLDEAMNVVVNKKLLKAGGEGGMIGVDAKGNVAMVFNSEGMYRGMATSEAENRVAIYKQ